MFKVGDKIVYPMHRSWSNRNNRGKVGNERKASVLYHKNARRGEGYGTYCKSRRNRC